MQTKTFEIRDIATFIPAIAISVEGTDGYLARSAGYGHRLILFGKLDGGAFRYDPYDWFGARTMPEAHKYIQEHWDELKDGDVVDVEFIRGERPEKKVSQQFDGGY